MERGDALRQRARCQCSSTRRWRARTDTRRRATRRGARTVAARCGRGGPGGHRSRSHLRAFRPRVLRGVVAPPGLASPVGHSTPAPRAQLPEGRQGTPRFLSGSGRIRARLVGVMSCSKGKSAGNPRRLATSTSCPASLVASPGGATMCSKCCVRRSSSRTRLPARSRAPRGGPRPRRPSSASDRPRTPRGTVLPPRRPAIPAQVGQAHHRVCRLDPEEADVARSSPEHRGAGEVGWVDALHRYAPISAARRRSASSCTTPRGKRVRRLSRAVHRAPAAGLPRGGERAVPGRSDLAHQEVDVVERVVQPRAAHVLVHLPAPDRHHLRSGSP